jgi:very-short-patch-repair endonuclease
MLCDYGCGKEATYYLPTVKKWCCSKKQQCCDIQKKKYSNSIKGRVPWNKDKKGIFSRETLERIGKSTSDRNKGKHLSEQTKLKISIGNSKPKLSKEFKERLRQEMLNGRALKMIKKIKKISKEEVKLRNMVKELYPHCKFQHSIFRFAIDVALVQEKLAIEYDGYYHFCSPEIIEYHKQRQEKIESEGWKLLRYTIFAKFPKKEQIQNEILRMINE